MTIDEALRLGTKRLSLCSSTPRLDSEVLLAEVLKRGRASLLAHLTLGLSPEELGAFDCGIERRAKGEPVAYITGHKEFYGLDLLLTPEVLVPRPETESLVEACLEALPEGEVSQVADIGTGSGAVLIAVGSQRPLVELFGTDISPQAVEVARLNCERHGLSDRSHLYAGDLLEPLEGLTFNVIAANLPYVPPGEAEPDVATWEPRVAVFGGGSDGTDVIRRFISQAPPYLRPGGRVVLETAHSQGKLISALAKSAFPGARVTVRKDLAGYDRIVVVDT
jgi:release factor glutamine methyltransferase